MPTPFSGRFAELYDALYAEKDYARDAAWIARHIRTSGGALPDAPASRPRVLDVACGTGRHAEQLVKRGFDVVGVDASEDMITAAKRREPGAQFHVGDMAALDETATIAPDSFHAAICLFDSLGYARTNERVASTLRGMARAVTTGGAIVVEVWHAAATFDAVRLRRLADGVTRISETSVDAATQLVSVRWTLWTPRGEPVEETHVNRFFGAQELASFVSAAGLELRSLTGGLDDVPITGSSFHVVAVAGKRARDGAPQ